MPPEDDLNIPSLSADFAADMLGGGPEDPPGNEPPPSPPVPPVPPTPPIDPTLALLTEDPLPKSYKKDLEPVWVKADKALREAIKAREADVNRGIQMYQGGYKQWDTITKPFEQVLKANPNFGPEQQAQLFTNLMTSHLRMLSLQGPEKVEFAKTLLKGYGLDVGMLTGAPGSTPPAPPAIPPEIQTKLGRVDALESTLNNYLLGEQKKAVDAFFNDPKNEYAVDVATEIHHLLETGAADSLQSAYEQAVWLNPTVRAKMVEKDIAERTRKAKEDADKARRLANLNRGGQGNDPGVPPKDKPKSVDDTVDEIVTKYTTTH